MGSKFITFPHPPNLDLEQFKADYLLITGESIQEPAPENEQGTHYMIGSWRITDEQFDALKVDYPLISKTNTWPVGWATKEAS